MKKTETSRSEKAGGPVRRFTKPVIDRLGEIPPRLRSQTINGKGSGGAGDGQTPSPPRSIQVFGNSVSLGRPNSVTLALGAAVLAVFFAILLANGRSANGETESSSTEVKRGVVEVTSSGSGSIESARDTDLNFESSGTVTAVFVDEGDKVKRGEAIAKLDRRSARLEVAVAKANLEDLENGVSTSTTGVAYRGNDSGSVETVNAVYTGSASTTPVAVISDATSQAVTGTTGVVCGDGESEVTDPTTGATTCETTTTGPTGPTGATGPAGGGGEPSTSPDEVVTTPSTESGAGLNTGGAVTGSAPSAGASAGGASGGTSSSVSDTDIESAKLDLQEAREAYRNTILRAPYSGTIVSLEGAVGDSVSGGSTSSSSAGSTDSTAGAASVAGADSSATDTSSSAFAVLQQLNALEMSVDVSEADINDIEVGQRATVSVSSADDEQLAATVSNVGLLASTDSSGVVTYPVTVRISQGSRDVRPGMSATVSIVIDQVSGAINVPNQALSGNTVEVEGSDGGTETKTVETGLVGDSTTEILSGLELGDTVLIPQATVSTDAAVPGGGEAATGGFPGGMPSGGSLPGGGAMPSGGMPSGGFPGG